MSEEQRLEQRLGAWAAVTDDSGDWTDVVRRAGELHWRPSSRRLALAIAVVVVGAAAAAGIVFATRAAGPTASRGPLGATGANGATGVGGATGIKGSTGTVGSTGDRTTSLGPVALDANQLKDKAAALGAPIYWAGPIDGDKYEFTRLRNGNIYVRYLPNTVRVGAPGESFRIVATYPRPGAFAALQEQAGGKAVSGPDGSIIDVNPNDPKSVFLAFPNVDYEIEIYDPSPAAALATAKSGDIRPVPVG